MAFCESTTGRTQVQLWYNRFKEGREDVTDDTLSGHLSTSKTDDHIEAVKKMILDDVGISFVSCQAIFTDVLFFILMDITQKILPTFKDDPDLLKKIITGHESRV